MVPVIGRTVPAWAADYVGRYNISIMFSFMSSFVVWSFWIPLQRNNTGVITFAVFYGIFSGAVIALTPALVAQIRYVRHCLSTKETCSSLFWPKRLQSSDMPPDAVPLESPLLSPTHT